MGRAAAAAASAAAVESLENRTLLSTVQWGAVVGSSLVATRTAVAGDFNGDGKLDVAGLSSTGVPVVAPGNGDGTFRAPVSSTKGFGSPFFAIAADLNKDGKLDLLALDSASGNAVFYPGNGDGTFSTPVTYPVGKGPTDAAAGDFNGDGLPDFAVANSGAGSGAGGAAPLSVYLGQAGGGFQAAPAISLPSPAFHLAAADFDGDGRTDLAVAYPTQNAVLLWGNADGTFTQSPFATPSSSGQTGVTAADLNKDGKPDLVVAEYNSQFQVILNQGQRSFSAPATYDSHGGGSGSAAYAANITNDGQPDLLVLSGGGVYASAMVGAGDGSFTFAGQPGFPQSAPAAVGDFNGDGLTDYAAASSSSAQLVCIPEDPVAGVGGVLANSFHTYRLDNVTLAVAQNNLTPDTPTAGLTAVVDWGDGQTSPATLVAGQGNMFSVVASHTYSISGGTYITARITAPDGLTTSIPAGNDTITDLPPAPGINTFALPGQGLPGTLTPGPAGKLWLTQAPYSSGGKEGPPTIDLVSTDGSIQNAYPAPVDPTGGGAFASDAAGNAWFSGSPYLASSAGTLYRMDASGTVTSYAVPGFVTALSTGPSGQIWFLSGPTRTTMTTLGQVAADGTVTTTPLSSTLSPMPDMTFGPGGNFWAPEPAKIARITPAGAVTEFAAPSFGTAADPGSVAAGPDGNLWYTDQTAHLIGKVTPAGVITAYQMPGINAPDMLPGDPTGISVGPDGALWFAEEAPRRIGRITTDGAYSDYLLDASHTFGTSVHPFVTAPGPDGNLWFTIGGTFGQLGRINIHNDLPVVTATGPANARQGVAFNGPVATFTDPTGTRSASDFAATIDWGDGTTSPGTVSSASGGGFVVNGTHTYAAEGNFTTSVTVTPPFDLPVRAFTTAAVDYPITATGAFQGFAVQGSGAEPVALMSFSDADPSGGSPSQFTVTVTWGDGQSGAGTVVAGPTKGTFIVQGIHAYVNTGTYAAHVTVKDIGGSPIAADAAVRVVNAVPLVPPVGYAAPAGLLAAGDFNGDGIPDLASAAPGTTQIDLLIGQAGPKGGTYPPASAAATAGGPVLALASGDFNHDGRADLAVTTSAAAGERTEIYLGTSAGTLAAADSFASRSGSIVAGDFNGDGVPDLATADAGNPDLVVALGKGDGAFTPSTVALSGGTSSLVAADFNGDKHDDLAAVLAGTTTVRVLLANPDGTFAAPATYAGSSVAAGAAGALAAAGDFNGDGRKDLAVANASTNTLLVLAGNGDGTFAAARSQPVDDGKPAGGAAVPVSGLTAADLNGDGDDDLLFATNPPAVQGTQPAPQLLVKLGEGPNTARPLSAAFPYTLSGTAPSAGPVAVVVRDLNGDGRPDVVVGAAGGGVNVLLNSPYVFTPVAPPPITEGAPFSNVVFCSVSSLSGTLSGAAGAGMTASIDWGDGTTSAGTLQAGANGSLNLSGSHTYQQAGTYLPTFSVTDALGVTAGLRRSVTVQDAPIQGSAGTFNAVTNSPVTALLSKFTDPNPFTRLSDMSATINWGTTTAGTVLDNGDGTYSVLGTHTYPFTGSYVATVTFSDKGGARATATATFKVAAPVNGGGSITGNVYDDANFDGARQAAEPALAGWSVFLDTNNNGAPDPGEPAAVTSAAGQYVLSDVPAGTWPVRLVLPKSATGAAKWQQTAPAPASANGGAQSVTLVQGQAVTGADFGATAAPSARVDVGPAVRGTAMDSATITFSEPVTGQLRIADLSLTLNGGPNLLTSAQTVSTTDNVHFQVQGLSGLTGAPGAYVLTLLSPAVTGDALTDASGNALASGALGTFTVAPPAVTTTQVGDGSAQRSTVGGLTVTFNQPVTLDPGAFTLAGRNGAGAGTSVTWSNPSGDGQTWLLSFTGPAVNAAGLSDGVYDLTAKASAVHPVGAAPGSPTYSMAADYTFSFFRLFGDSDGNGTVNALDYARFKQAFGSSSGSAGYNPAFDSDGNGTINALDYANFKNNFGKTLSLTAPPG